MSKPSIRPRPARLVNFAIGSEHLASGACTVIASGEETDVLWQPWIPWLDYKSFRELMESIRHKAPSLKNVADLISETFYPLCKSDTETPWHLFVKCPFASAIWFGGPLPLRVNALPCVDMVAFISDLCNNSSLDMRTSILICAATTFETI
ncbi:hypothetical protein F8388_002911 [Cannabis sativa]|uniref:Reverse transcriptase zinc-binding domain-containing protein n=1 Tax=Cannabis sativa TaxID=3483 RepID=A0A7J6H6B3_CANSA|nr:hypothetical protein F8388_002911 [Cannabis sativa]